MCFYAVSDHFTTKISLWSNFKNIWATFSQKLLPQSRPNSNEAHDLLTLLRKGTIVICDLHRYAATFFVAHQNFQQKHLGCAIFFSHCLFPSSLEAFPKGKQC